MSSPSQQPASPTVRAVHHRYQLIEAAKSAGRVFAAAALAAYLSTGKAPSALRPHDLLLLADAGASALVLTAVNWLRDGETRFGIPTPDQVAAAGQQPG